MQKLDIIMYTGNSFIGKLIKKISNSQKYSHCAFYLGEFHCLESAWNNPCVIKHFKYESDEYDVFRLNVELTEDEIIKVENYILKHLNSGYDYLYLITRGLNYMFNTPVYNTKNTMTCDELIVESLRQIGINLMDDEILSPELISKSKLLHKVN